MQRDSSSNDPTSHWPSEVKKAYEHLEVPSLYDCALINEKLSLELRKQNKEMRAMNEEIQSISSRITAMMKIFEEDLEIYEVEDEESDLIDSLNGVSTAENKIILQAQNEVQHHIISFLIETFDSLVETCKQMRQTLGQLLALILPKDNTDSSSVPSHSSSQELAGFLIEQIDNMRYHTIRRLEEWGVYLIEPQSGEMFMPAFHHALEQTQGGTAGTIARVVRVGYRKGDIIIRSADVVVYA